MFPNLTTLAAFSLAFVLTPDPSLKFSSPSKSANVLNAIPTDLLPFIWIGFVKIISAAGYPELFELVLLSNLSFTTIPFWLLPLRVIVPEFIKLNPPLSAYSLPMTPTVSPSPPRLIEPLFWNHITLLNPPPAANANHK